MNLFKVPKHRRYEYIPRYYDPEKEEREARLRRREKMSEASVEGAKLFLILVMLIALCLALLEIYLPQLLEKF
jgi:hypothetical protein